MLEVTAKDILLLLAGVVLAIPVSIWISRSYYTKKSAQIGFAVFNFINKDLIGKSLNLEINGISIEKLAMLHILVQNNGHIVLTRENIIDPNNAKITIKNATIISMQRESDVQDGNNIILTAESEHEISLDLKRLDPSHRAHYVALVMPNGDFSSMDINQYNVNLQIKDSRDGIKKVSLSPNDIIPPEIIWQRSKYEMIFIFTLLMPISFGVLGVVLVVKWLLGR